MIDVDQLKKVNDTFGHAAGDNLLRRLGSLLKGAVRQTDLVGRLGGDEFGIFMPNTTEAEATMLVDRLQNAVSEHNAIHPYFPPIRVGVGLSFSNRHGVSALRAQADAQLYLYKKSRPVEHDGHKRT
jgi:diguanylate cyclase (GGDEF)-like protein